MNQELFELAVKYTKKNLPYFIKFDNTIESALEYFIRGKTEITEQSIKAWIKNSFGDTK